MKRFSLLIIGLFVIGAIGSTYGFMDSKGPTVSGVAYCPDGSVSLDQCYVETAVYHPALYPHWLIGMILGTFGYGSALGLSIVVIWRKQNQNANT